MAVLTLLSAFNKRSKTAARPTSAIKSKSSSFRLRSTSSHPVPLIKLASPSRSISHRFPPYRWWMVLPLVLFDFADFTD